MNEEQVLKSFLGYYHSEKKRLSLAQKKYNEELQKDSNPLIRRFKTDLADMDEGGKLLRGMLVELGYKAAGGTKDGESEALALAFEIFQTAVLVHDDIIDNAETRRGKLTIHRRYEHRLNVRGIRAAAGAKNTEVAKSAALCAGDIGLYLSNLKLVEAYGTHPRFPELLKCFDEIILDTMRGELLDVVLPYELQDQIYTEEERCRLLEKSVRDIYLLKTAKYSVIGPLKLGMMLAGAPETDIKAIERFGEDAGTAFQIMDDILGIYADPETLGKDIGSDISEYKQTILWMYVRTRCPEATEQLLRYYGKKKVSEEDLDAVRGIFRETGALDYARDAMNACFRRAENKLSRMRFLSKEDRDILKGFLVYLKGRKK